ncbi:MAG TPA: hypothetical protein VMJ64_13015 [Anaerolineales bacterium]|nr:hypothetical protein [Anaerolineales bacterium]
MVSLKPERDKKSGVYYAATDDGFELPVVDVMHPGFALSVSGSEMDRLMQKHMQGLEQQRKAPAFLQSIMLRLMMRQSRLMRALSGAEGTYLGGVDTYLLKLGPDNMGKAYASAIDRQIAASLPGLSVRLRLQDVAYLLADGLQPLLAAASGQPLRFVNIGGGPAIDTLNALMVLQRREAALLQRRSIAVHVLDLDPSGPHFGARMLGALQAPGAPLNGLKIEFEHITYNWSDTAPLQNLLRSLDPQALVAASSEGALFEYGSDTDIIRNLRVLHDESPGSAVLAGSVTRADEIGRVMNSGSRAALQLRGIDAFLALARESGWSLAERIDRPISHDISLKKA